MGSLFTHPHKETTDISKQTTIIENRPKNWQYLEQELESKIKIITLLNNEIQTATDNIVLLKKKIKELEEQNNSNSKNLAKHATSNELQTLKSNLEKAQNTINILKNVDTYQIDLDWLTQIGIKYNSNIAFIWK